MLATPGSLPPARLDPAFAYEFKWDGVRAVAHVDGRNFRLSSRNDNDVVGAYPELIPLWQSLAARPVVLDGEVVAVDPASGRISFGALQHRMHVTDRSRARRLAEANPVTYLIFDVLHLDGHRTTGLTYAERRQALESLGLSGPRWATPPTFTGGGAGVLATSREQGLEGVVAKRRDSVYLPGRRSPSWVKVKNVRAQEVVIGGWTAGRGSRGGTIGSLVLGVPGPDGLQYVGNVGTGFTRSMLADVLGQLRRIEQPASAFVGVLPARGTEGARWTRPDLVGEVEFAEWTRDGRLRHPTWRGLRPDKDPGDVVRES